MPQKKVKENEIILEAKNNDQTNQIIVEEIIEQSPVSCCYDK